MKTDDFGDRIKSYETCPDIKLPERLPLIVRLDGKAFHTFTKRAKVKKPFSKSMHNAMCQATIALCSNIQNIRFGYTQSDEISLLIYPKKTTSHPWLGNRLQKIVSITAGIATAHFNLWAREWSESSLTPHFDSRAFVLPIHEVKNYFWWRQSDAIRNSVSMLAQSKFSHQELHGKDCETMIEMLRQEYSLNWDDLELWCKQGSLITKDEKSYRARWTANGALHFLESESFNRWLNSHLTDPIHPE